MQNKKILLLILLFIPSSVFAINFEKVSRNEESQLIKMAKTRKALDGVSILEVLRYVEKLRPKKFKVADNFELDYDYTGHLSGVGVCYWIGKKRSDEYKYCDISWEISKDRKSISPRILSLKENAEYSTVMQIEAGRDAFLKYIDEFYELTCTDPYTKKHYC